MPNDSRAFLFPDDSREYGTAFEELYCNSPDTGGGNVADHIVTLIDRRRVRTEKISISGAADRIGRRSDGCIAAGDGQQPHPGRIASPGRFDLSIDAELHPVPGNCGPSGPGARRRRIDRHAGRCLVDRPSVSFAAGIRFSRTGAERNRSHAFFTLHVLVNASRAAACRGSDRA